VSEAITLLLAMDRDLVEIVLRSLAISVSAVLIAALIGIPAGAALALGRFPGAGLVNLMVNGFMGLPPVVVGLIVFLMLSHTGPLGVLGLLYTPTAMVIAQTLLVLPIVMALSRDALGHHYRRLGDLFKSFGRDGFKAVPTLIREARFDLATGVLAGFGRASAEVGAVMIVGGNIEHHTRVMTTAIVLETSKGELGLALALGLVLIVVTVAVTALAGRLNRRPVAWR